MIEEFPTRISVNKIDKEWFCLDLNADPQGKIGFYEVIL
jgi:hypothetical protein